MPKSAIVKIPSNLDKVPFHRNKKLMIQYSFNVYVFIFIDWQRWFKVFEEKKSLHIEYNLAVKEIVSKKIIRKKKKK